MSRLIKKFSDGTILEFDRGSFDDWCVYLTRPTLPRFAPRDIQYFTRLQQLARKHTAEKLYADFRLIYDATSKELSDDSVTRISTMAQSYDADELSFDVVFTMLYAGMVAELNKAKTKLGKRVKRLGVHQVLLEKKTPEFAATFSKGKSWREIEEECNARGF